MAKSSKGSAFERLICTELSLWWTDGERDDVFWRTSISGGRATTRGKKGKQTTGQHGDVAATDPIGKPLIDLITIEIKRGYSKSSIQDLIDRSDKSAQQEYEKWIDKAITSSEAAGSDFWMIITRRDQRKAIVLMPQDLFYHALSDSPHYFTFSTKIRRKNKKKVQKMIVYGLLLDDFFKYASQRELIMLKRKIKINHA